MRSYSLKKRMVAFVLAIAVVFGSNSFYNLMRVVEAEDNTNPDLVAISKVELLNDNSTEVAPGVLRFNITGSAREGIFVEELALYFQGTSGKEVTLVYSYEDSTSHWEPGVTGSSKEISVTLPDYIGNQQFELTAVRLASTEVNHLYTYYSRGRDADGYTDVFYGNLMGQTEYDAIQFVYDGSADFTVTGSQEEDSIAPTIQSIERIIPSADETIGANTTVTYRLNYTEEGAGIRHIEMAFNNGTSWDTYYRNFEAPYKGELTLTSYNRNLGDYELQFIDITDYANNQVRYQWSEEDSSSKSFGYTVYTPQYAFVPVGEDFFVNGADAYSVEMSEYQGVKVTSVEVETDEDKSAEGKQLNAGETYTAYVTLNNSGTESINVDPSKLYVTWVLYANSNSWRVEAYGEGTEQALASGESITIPVPFTVNKYWSALTMNLNSVYINYCEEEYSFDIAYIADDTENRECLEGRNSDWELIDTVDNSAILADFVVVPGEYEDTEAPVLASISSAVELVKVPGEATLDIVVSDEGNAQLERVMFIQIADVADSRNALYISEQYDSTFKKVGDNTYRYSFELPKEMIKGTYAVTEIVYYDEAGNYKDYTLQDNKLVDWSNSSNQTEACYINIDSEYTELDLDYPIIKDLQLNDSDGQIIAGDSIEFEIEVYEKHGLSNVRLDYMTGAGSDYFYVDTGNGISEIEEITAVNEGCKRFRVKAWSDKYCLEEAYNLIGIVVCDDSSRYNSCYYSYDGINNTYVLVSTADEEEPVTFTPETNLGLTVSLPQGMYLSGVNDIQTTLQTLPSDAKTLVVKKNDENVALYGEDLKDKNVDIIVSDADETSEIQISSELFSGEDALENLQLNVSRDYLVEEEMYYPVQVVSSESDIALMLCVRLDEEFLSQANGGNIALYDGDGNLLQENLTVNARGEVTVALEQLKEETASAYASRGITLETHEFRIGLQEEETLKFSGASLTLYNDIAVNYKVSKALLEENGYNNPYVKFVFNGKEVIVTSYYEEGDKYVFDFANLAPNQMNDTIYATLYATKDGELCASEVTQYSVAEYCYKMLEKYSSQEGYAEFCTLLVDLLNYGAASQTYTNYNIENLVNNQLTEEQKAMGTDEMREMTSVFNKAFESVSDPTVTWKGASLILKDSVTISFTIETDDIDNTVATVRCKDQEWNIDHSKFVKASDNKYYIYFEGLNAAQMSDTVYVTITEDGVAVSDTVAYSIESYAYAKLNNANTEEALQDILNAVMKYGDAAKDYLDSISN